ncbi:alpha/beta hydrolase [Cellulophaga sp. F20128]|uniref:alpha/beta hydrolase family protein n=1 Tax=Cellulophaga sp. F20128 TaxID=2926413 RepID=UPI001FF61243|nr:alpha/beta hydrolase [Cellulophaga sp. F20128]MCK0158388.1 alpha/beta hydrolase [Cellulophaga sp. F20128]
MKNVILLLFFLPSVVFSQEIITEELDLKNKNIFLPGTLSYPKLKKKVPLVLFIHGSGNIDRNGNQTAVGIKANYIKLLSDSLVANGIAFYRYDKRTAIVENLAKEKDITIQNFADDAMVALQHFKNDKRFNGIHLIGHSQGSLIAMLSFDKNIKSYISLAGAGQTIDQTVIAQVTQQSQELGSLTKEHFDELLKTDTILKVNPLLVSIFHPNNQKFFKSWALIDPKTEIKKINVPILILNGDADLQVTNSDAQLLKDASPLAEIHSIKKMNHLLKEVNSLEENQRSYTDPNFSISKELVVLIKEFIIRNE